MSTALGRPPWHHHMQVLLASYPPSAAPLILSAAAAAAAAARPCPPRGRPRWASRTPPGTPPGSAAGAWQKAEGREEGGRGRACAWVRRENGGIHTILLLTNVGERQRLCGSLGEAVVVRASGLPAHLVEGGEQHQSLVRWQLAQRSPDSSTRAGGTTDRAIPHHALLLDEGRP